MSEMDLLLEVLIANAGPDGELAIKAKRGRASWQAVIELRGYVRW